MSDSGGSNASDGSVRRLDNTDLGFPTSCFVCEPTNEFGLRIPFDHDVKAGVVQASFRLDARFSGAPTYLHGGITLAILDEAMAWGAIALGGKFAVTAQTSARFLHPVRVERDYQVVARLSDADETEMNLTAQIFDHRDRLCTEAEARFVVISAAKALDALGTEATNADAAFLGDS